jgi:capsular polysaccharide export protein
VETDGSILYGSPTVRTNIDLLTQVRARNPNSYILYKRHPDIVAGLRASEVCEDKIASLCDERVDHVDIVTLIDGSDEVHVMTSLTGFEALMRGKEVVCYGQPFYAGWGLTTDLAPIARRLHKITLDHLVAMALIVYPVYMSADGQRLITPEEALDELTTLALAPNRGAVLKKALRCGLRLRARYHGS